MQTVILSLAFISAWSLISAAVLYLRDRTGNSGRQTHLDANPRIRQPGEHE